MNAVTFFKSIVDEVGNVLTNLFPWDVHISAFIIGAMMFILSVATWRLLKR